VACLALEASGTTTPAQIYARIERFGRETPQVGVTLRSQVRGAPVGIGTFVWASPNRQRYSMRAGFSDYTFVQNGNRAIEFEARSKNYFEFGVSNRLVTPFARVDETPAYGYPDVIVPGSVAQGRIISPKTRYLGSSTVQGVRVDEIETIEEAPGSRAVMNLWADDRGRIRRYRWRTDGPNGSMEITFDVTEWTDKPAISATTFDTRPPLVYTPFELPFLPEPIEPGLPVAWRGTLTDLTSQRPVPATQLLAKDRPTIIILTEPACVVSQRARVFLGQVLDLGKRRNARCWRISLGNTSPATGSADLWDQTEAVERAIGVPGTPLIMLFGRDGRLIRAWLGDPPESRDRVLDEISRSFPPR